MKTTTTTNTTESTTVKAISMLDKALNTLDRIQGNNDVETFRKECIAFRTLCGATPSKVGLYTMPKGYTDFIDTVGGSSSDDRSKRQATVKSIIACFDLGKKGSRATAYLAMASKGKTALEAILPHEWAIIKTKVNLEEKNAKAKRDADKLAKLTPVLEVVGVEIEVVGQRPTVSALEVVASKASTDAKPLNKVVMLETVALGADSEERVTRSLNSLTKFLSEPELKRLAILINNYLA